MGKKEKWSVTATYVHGKVTEEQRDQFRALHNRYEGYDPTSHELDLSLLYWIKLSEEKSISIDEMIEQEMG